MFQKSNSIDAALNPDIDDDNHIYDPDTGGGTSWNSHVDNESMPGPSANDSKELTGSGTETSPYIIYGQNTFNQYINKANQRNGGSAAGYTYGKINNDFSFIVSDYDTDMCNSYLNDFNLYGNIYLDGNYKRVSLDIDVDVSDSYPRSIGLIGSIPTAYIKNLKVTGNVDVSGNSIESVGGVIGCCTNAWLDNCYIAPNITVRRTNNPSRSTYVAGIVGMTTSLNQNTGSGSLRLDNTVFCGRLDLTYDIAKDDPYSTAGCSTATQNLATNNSYYKYQKIVVANSINEIKESNNIELKSFNDAYGSYLQEGQSKKFIKGKWHNYTFSDYYYSAYPNLSWLINRSNITPTEFNYRVNKAGYSTGSPVKVAWAIDPRDVSVDLASVAFTDLGEKYEYPINFTIDKGYEIRSSGHTFDTNECTVDINLDCKISVLVDGVYLNGSSTKLEASEVSVGDSGSIVRLFPDEIAFSSSVSNDELACILTNGASRKSIIRQMASNPSRFVYVGWKVGSESGDNLALRGTLDQYRSFLELNGDSYVLKIYAIAKLKQYSLIFKEN